jgi:carbonic anhydrase/acetyltransferase-like protein (isoleucine patch superfamily)
MEKNKNIYMKISYTFLKVNSYFGYKALVFMTKIKYKCKFYKLGKGTVIYKPIKFFDLKNVQLGNDVRIFKGSRIETIRKWGKENFTPKINIGDKTSFEQNLHMTCAGKIEIGSNVTVLANVMITDIDHSYMDINKNTLHQNLIVQNVKIGDFCFIGMDVKIMPGTILGKNCIVGANSLVKGIFPDYSVIVGTPGRIIKKYNFDKNQWHKTNNLGEFIFK